MRPTDLVASLLDSPDANASARKLTVLAERRSSPPPARAKPSPPPTPPPPVQETSNPFKRKAKKLPVENAQVPDATEQETIANPVEPPAIPKVESMVPEPEPEPIVVPEPPAATRIDIAPPTVTSARDLAEQEIVDLILRAQRVSKSTGAPLEVCLEELRKHLAPKPVVAEAATKQKVRRLEFQTSKDGLLTGAKVIDE